MAASSQFDRVRLSTRENEILELAIEGMTDIQIAQRLEISQSTVNSYWVRIRGKLGQLSRTELVALALKQQARTDLELALARSREFESQAREHAQMSDDFRQAESYHAALDALPEAMMFTCDSGIIRYTNERFALLFGYAADELIGQGFEILLPARLRSAERAVFEAHVAEPQPLRIGIDRVLFGRRRDGSEFRIIVLLDSCPTSTGRIVSWIVRDFVTEIDVRRAFASAIPPI